MHIHGLHTFCLARAKGWQAAPGDSFCQGSRTYRQRPGRRGMWPRVAASRGHIVVDDTELSA